MHHFSHLHHANSEQQEKYKLVRTFCICIKHLRDVIESWTNILARAKWTKKCLKQWKAETEQGEGGGGGGGSKIRWFFFTLSQISQKRHILSYWVLESLYRHKSPKCKASNTTQSSCMNINSWFRTTNTKIFQGFNLQLLCYDVESSKSFWNPPHHSNAFRTLSLVCKGIW